MAQNVVPDAGSEASVLIEDLVANIPGIDLALVTAEQRVDVVLHDRGQGCLVADRRNPARQLRVPDGGVAADELVIVRGKLHRLISRCEAEGSLGRFGRVPLHTVIH